MIENAKSLSDFISHQCNVEVFVAPSKASDDPIYNLLFHISFGRTSAQSKWVIRNWKYLGWFVFFFS